MPQLPRKTLSGPLQWEKERKHERILIMRIKIFLKQCISQRIKQGKAETVRQELIKGATFEKQLRLKKTGRRGFGYLVSFSSVERNF